MFPATTCTTTSPTTISPLLVTCLVLLLTAPQAPGQERREKPDRFYIGGVLSSASTARAFTMEAQVRTSHNYDNYNFKAVLPKKYRDRRGNVLKGRHWFVVPCCVYFVLFCLGCPEQLIKLFANSPGQARQDTGQEVSIYRQNRTDCLSSFQYFTPPISILLE